MKTTIAKSLLHLQNWFKYFLEDNCVDIIRKHKDHFEIGWPTNENNGTAWLVVYPVDNGIKVYSCWWDETFSEKVDHRTYMGKYLSIDDWMLKAYDITPSDKKSNPKKNYRR